MTSITRGVLIVLMVGRNPGINSPVEVGSWNPIIYIIYQGFRTIPGGCLGFLNHEQYWNGQNPSVTPGASAVNNFLAIMQLATKATRKKVQVIRVLSALFDAIFDCKFQAFQHDDDDDDDRGQVTWNKNLRRRRKGRSWASEARVWSRWKLLKIKKVPGKLQKFNSRSFVICAFFVNKEIFQFQKMHIDIQKEHGLTSPIGGCPTQLGCQLCTAYPWAEIVKWKRIGTNSLLLWNGYTPVI